MGYKVSIVYLTKEIAGGPFTTIESPIEKSVLFGGRHHGNMQDSRDYLAWEEALPDQIDPVIYQLWLQLLGKTAV